MVHHAMQTALVIRPDGIALMFMELLPRQNPQTLQDSKFANYVMGIYSKVVLLRSPALHATE